MSQDYEKLDKLAKALGRKCIWEGKSKSATMKFEKKTPQFLFIVWPTHYGEQQGVCAKCSLWHQVPFQHHFQ